MKKLIYDGTTYYYQDGKLYDKSFLEIPKAASLPILSNYYAQVDYSEFSEQELINYIKAIKNSELYTLCINVISFGANKFSDSLNYLNIVFPIVTSCYRLSENPQKAIDFWISKKDKYRSILSNPLLTSLAAAYCDVKNYRMALYCAKKAYEMQGGKIGYKNELSLVYERIRKEAPELFKK